MRYVTVSPKWSLTSINLAHGLSAPQKPQQPYARSKGTHLSTVTSRIDRESGRIKEKIVFGRNTFEELDEEDLPACMAAGFALEDLLIKLNPWVMRVGEIHLDGIAMSPDGATFESKRHLLSPDKPQTINHEFKATWKSSRKMLEEFLPYLRQTKSYCKGLGTRYTILWIFHVNGGYRFEGEDSGPCLKQHHIEYSPFEIESNWAEILRKKKEFGL